MCVIVKHDKSATIHVQGCKPIEEVAMAETCPVILHTRDQAWLVVDGQPVLETPPTEAPEMLLSAYYVFNIAYSKQLKPLMTILEKLVFKRYITTPGQIATRVCHLLQSYSTIQE